MGAEKGITTTESFNNEVKKKEKVVEFGESRMTELKHIQKFYTTKFKRAIEITTEMNKLIKELDEITHDCLVRKNKYLRF